jgi:iron complex transport system permease protein
VLCLGLIVLEIILGTVSIPPGDAIAILFGAESDHPSWEAIIRLSRLPRALTAILAGSGLALGGLLMQTFFRNPLAGPSVLGITSGSSLGVALFVLATGSMAEFVNVTGIGGSLSIAAAAWVGAMIILLLILGVSNRLSEPVTLVVFRLMIGYIVSAAVTVLQFESGKDALRVFVLWGMGSFEGLGSAELGLLALGTGLGLIISIVMIKHLNIMLLGEDEARSLGVPFMRIRIWMIIATGVLAGTVTAFCGPVAFLGLAVPHLARGLFKTSDHKIIVPGVLLVGCSLGLLCDLLSRMPWTQGGIPLNAVTGIIGAPVVIWVILKNRRLGRLI